MDMRIDAAGGEDFAFAGNRLCAGPITMSTPGCVSGLPALPIAAMRPFFNPTSALTIPQWSTINALVITVSTAPSRDIWLWPMPSRITLPPPNFTSSP